MRFYQNQQFEMAQRVAVFLKNTSNLFSAKVPALQDIIGDFSARQEQLYKLSVRNKNIIKVSTNKTKDIRQQFIDIILILSEMLQAYHSQNGNKPAGAREPALGSRSSKELFEYTTTALGRLSADKLCVLSKKIIAAARKVKNRQRYGVTAKDMKDAKAYYKEFTKAKNQPKLRKAENANMNTQLETGVKEDLSFLKKTIDPLMRIATRDNAQMRFKYENMRKVLPRGQGRPSDKEAAYRKSRMKKRNSKLKPETGT